ncbi:hypothetical protein [Streptomyces sp. NPDC056049]|uniref:hypothetical protein n=1 Tax=Streptomyces sp. NPDC056049 TaxID=3345693 RepID=UPI0035DC5FF8
MPERTHPTQQDEALRQARHDDLRNGLQHAADKLTAAGPGKLMSDTDRLTAAQDAGRTAHPHSENAASHLTRALLRLMPHVTQQAVTRGEYALWLRKTSWSA